MNKLYLLAALGFSANANSGTFADGYDAGDCLVPSDFYPTFGYVAFDCGDECH